MATAPSRNTIAAAAVPAGPRSEAVVLPLREYYEDEVAEAAGDGETSRSAEDGEEGEADPGFSRSAMAERIWARLNQRAGLELANIRIQMERDMVRVTGFVATDAARRRIADCVSACAGVRVLRNGIRLAS